MLFDYDVIVVGGGAGGATFAYACARAGKSVLVLERGKRSTPTSPSHDEKAMLIDKRPYDDREVDVNGSARRLYMGGVLGGGTSLYGGALIRPSEEDFQPGKYYGKRIPRAIWDWPISYEDLEPHYTEAEQLYGVAGCGEEDLDPLAKARRRLSQRSSAASSPQPEAHRRQSRSWLASISFAPCDRLVSMPALRRMCGLHLSHGRAVPPRNCSSERSPKATPSRSRLKSKWSAWSRNAAAERLGSPCSTVSPVNAPAIGLAAMH